MINMNNEGQAQNYNKMSPFKGREIMGNGGATSQLDNIIQSLSPMRRDKKDHTSATPKVIKGGYNGRLVDEIIS